MVDHLFCNRVAAVDTLDLVKAGSNCAQEKEMVPLSFGASNRSIDVWFRCHLVLAIVPLMSDKNR
jgi:hypothetical protein